MKQYIKTRHIVRHLIENDEETYDELKDILVRAAKEIIGDDVEDVVGDALVFVWFCVVLIKHYAGTTQAENLRISFISNCIEECEDDGGVYFIPLLPGTSTCVEWEDYCSIYGSLEELFDSIFDIGGDQYDMIMMSLAESYAKECNIEDDLMDIVICNFEFTSGDQLGNPILIFN